MTKQKLLENKYKLAIAILSTSVIHSLVDLQRLGALDESSIKDIVGVFEINIKKNGML